MSSNFKIGSINAVNVAMGDNARVNAPGQRAEAITLPALVLPELYALQREMERRPESADQSSAVTAVGCAIEAARAGDAGQMTDHLKRAGKWALDVATAIGAELIGAIIRSALGIK